jgi:hypothetical protein
MRRILFTVMFSFLMSVKCHCSKNENAYFLIKDIAAPRLVTLVFHYVIIKVFGKYLNKTHQDLLFVNKSQDILW